MTDSPQGPHQQRVRNLAPARFRAHTFRTSLDMPVPRAHLWAWLNDPDTFVKGQIPPYRVEFVEGSGEGGTSGFHPGVQNIHHGPLLAVAGELGEIDPGPDSKGRYRDLQYYYGSYAISFRLIRPTRIQFWLEDSASRPESNTTLTVQIDSYVKPSVDGLWTGINRIFWNRFFK